MQKKLLGCAVACLLLSGCGKDDDFPLNDYPINIDVSDGYNIDKIADDVAQIAILESDDTAINIDCATITDEISGSNRIRTIDFGASNCTLFTGNQVRGKIILTFETDFGASTRNISFAFENFFHNNRYVLGNRDVTKTTLENGHPQVKINLNMIVTGPTGTTFTRIGERTREFTAGFDTPGNVLDDSYLTTGSWSTTISVTKMTSIAQIESPITVTADCDYISSGLISYTREDGEYLSFDYGDGTCDNKVLFTLNGITSEAIIP
ncbi:hypothetical protein [Flavobacterium caeni]|uniref:Lipoprotein n=1 Tax=Flavobacterium caeni TaxID=490189 RepID=A0A1G5I5L0_9FLAO|nr:hypothetical protein [Flavobacterium caeni]SCY71313.1 hypothetical protein SAMN02927903_02113 [Flavobacterium caeni]